MPDVVWPLSWALVGLLFAVYAARRAWLEHRIARRELAAVRRYGELREGEYASIGGAAAKRPGGFDVVMEGGRVRAERATADDEVGAKADDIVAVETDRPVYVSGIVERGADGGFSIRAAPGHRMAVATRPLWQRAARRRLAHGLVAFTVAFATVELFRFLAWDALRLTFQGTRVHATLSNPRDTEEKRFSLWDFGFRKVRRIRLDATHPAGHGGTRRFTTVVDPDTEWLWSLTADQAEVRRLGIEPVVQWFVILPREPSVHQLGEKVRLEMGAAMGPFALFALVGVPYWLILVRPALHPRRRRGDRIIRARGSAV